MANRSGPGVGTPRRMSRTQESEKQNGTQSAETIKASGHVHRINRPDTRLHPTKAPNQPKSLQRGSHPHKTFDAV
jgi:hypothetical protein